MNELHPFKAWHDLGCQVEGCRGPGSVVVPFEGRPFALGIVPVGVFTILCMTHQKQLVPTAND